VRLHPNARTTPRSRARLVQRVRDDGWPAARVARAFHVSERTVWKWVARYRREGAAGLADRSGAPQRQPRRTAPRRVLTIVALRAQRLPGHVIARRVGLPRSTVGGVLRRAGLGRLRPLTAPPPVRRYERAPAGELARLSRARASSSSHPAVHPAHQRQSRALHPDAPARVGVPPRVPLVRPTAACAGALAALLQLPSTPHGAQLPMPDDPAHGGCGVNNVFGRNS
jgi:transposase